MKDPLEEVQIAESRQGSVAVLLAIVGFLLLLFVVSPWVAAILVGLVVMIMLHEAGHLIAARGGRE